MMRILKFSDSDFAQQFKRIEQRADEVPDNIEETVKAIIADVRQRGDAALFELSFKFDRIDLTADTIEVSEAEMDAALATVSAESLAALQQRTMQLSVTISGNAAFVATELGECEVAWVQLA